MKYLRNLLLRKAAIEEELYGCEQSIITCKEALRIWKNEYEPTLTNNVHHSQGIRNSSSGNCPSTRSQNASINFEIDGKQT
ncbi:unnamed protein product, partial [Rotaria sp. Silwood2]